MSSHHRLLLTTLLSLVLLPAAAAETQQCENGLVGGPLPTDAGADLPTGTSVDLEVIRCYTVYEDPIYAHGHRSVNASVEDDATGFHAQAHVSEYAGGVNNDDNGTSWSYYGYVASADVGDRDGTLPQAEVLVHHYGTSVNDEDDVRDRVRAGFGLAGSGTTIDEDFQDPYNALYETYLEPLLP